MTAATSSNDSSVTSYNELTKTVLTIDVEKESDTISGESSAKPLWIWLPLDEFEITDGSNYNIKLCFKFSYTEEKANGSTLNYYIINYGKKIKISDGDLYIGDEGVEGFEKYTDTDGLPKGDYSETNEIWITSYSNSSWYSSMTNGLRGSSYGNKGAFGIFKEDIEKNDCAGILLQFNKINSVEEYKYVLYKNFEVSNYEEVKEYMLNIVQN